MAYVVWKFQGSHGPYAYLYESVWQDGKSRSRYLRYLGRFGRDGPASVEPGSVVVGPDGRELVVPPFSPGVIRQMAAFGGSPSQLGSRSSDGGGPDLGSRSEAPDGDDLGSRSDGARPELGSRFADCSEVDLGSSSEAADGDDLGSRSEDGDLQLGSRSTDGSGSELGSRPDPVPPVAARPHRLPDGSWGCLLPGGGGPGRPGPGPYLRGPVLDGHRG